MSLLHRARREKKHYLNPVPTSIGGLKTMLEVLPKYLSNREETEPRIPLGPFATDAAIYRQPPANGLRVTWFGHSASLVEMDGVRLLIDPVWEQRASPTQRFGPKRFFAPTLPLEDLPPIDAILLSHDHYDHLGRHTVGRLAQLNATAGARWITADGVGKRLRSYGVAQDRVTELNWTQSVSVAGAELGTSVEIQSLPARHFSGRTPFDRFTTLWGSYALLGTQHRVYYGADSGPWPGFAEIGEQYGPFDLTMLEIGAYSPLWADIHLGPDAAAEAYLQMGGRERAGLFMPIHWGLFNLALHGWRQPIERLTELAAEKDLPLWSPVPGVPTEVAEPLQSMWWAATG
jgi:L-ascorbate metabolism protein UlaG (beta-lactamase superfamily)